VGATRKKKNSKHCVRDEENVEVDNSFNKGTAAQANEMTK
jgi:hypothetical protein